MKHNISILRIGLFFKNCLCFEPERGIPIEVFKWRTTREIHGHPSRPFPTKIQFATELRPCSHVWRCYQCAYAGPNLKQGCAPFTYYSQDILPHSLCTLSGKKANWRLNTLHGHLKTTHILLVLQTIILENKSSRGMTAATRAPKSPLRSHLRECGNRRCSSSSREMTRNAR